MVETIAVAFDVAAGEEPLAVLVDGALHAASTGIECILVGPEDDIAACLPSTPPPGLAIEHAVSTILMGDDPVRAIRDQRDSSTAIAMRLVRTGRAAAMVTPANTGAVVIAAGGCLGRTRGVIHPALATLLPRPHPTPTVLVDCGASVRRSATWMRQFATMGALVAEHVLDVDAPRIGLVANGTESIKGDDTLREADGLLADEARYVGFVEPSALLGDAIDVAVSDGLTGNLVLKSLVAGSRVALTELQKAVAAESVPDAARDVVQLGTAWFASERRIGALLLGVNGTVVKIPGASLGFHVTTGASLAAAAVSARLVEEVTRAFG